MGWIDSPLAGADGNREFLLALKKSPEADTVEA